jgi:hypothetical protein
MAVLDNDTLTLLEFAQQLDPNGQIADVAHLLSQTNQILDDAQWAEANELTTHQVTVETGLPEVYWRALNEGVQSSIGHTAQVKEPLGILEARSRIDIDLAMLNGNTAKYRLQEGRRFLESMNQEWATSLFYSDPAVDRKKPMGLTVRYSDPTAGNGSHILDAGGTSGDLTSVWLVVWGSNSLFLPYPKGSKVGLLREDLGRYTAQNVGGVQGSEMEVLGERFQMKWGVALKDWRYVVRIANVDVDALMNSGSGTQSLTAETNLIKKMIEAMGLIPNLDMGRAVFYCNRRVRTGLSIQAMDKSQSCLSIAKGARQFALDFLGVQIKLCDSLLSTEDQVVFA